MGFANGSLGLPNEVLEHILTLCAGHWPPNLPLWKEERLVLFNLLDDFSRIWSQMHYQSSTIGLVCKLWLGLITGHRFAVLRIFSPLITHLHIIMEQFKVYSHHTHQVTLSRPYYLDWENSELTDWFIGGLERSTSNWQSVTHLVIGHSVSCSRAINAASKLTQLKVLGLYGVLDVFPQDTIWTLPSIERLDIYVYANYKSVPNSPTIFDLFKSRVIAPSLTSVYIECRISSGFHIVDDMLSAFAENVTLASVQAGNDLWTEITPSENLLPRLKHLEYPFTSSMLLLQETLRVSRVKVLVILNFNDLWSWVDEESRTLLRYTIDDLREHCKSLVGCIIHLEPVRRPTTIILDDLLVHPDHPGFEVS